MVSKLPLVTGGLKKRLWAIIILVTGYLIYVSLGDLIPDYWSFLGFRPYERTVVSLGLLIILLFSLSGLAASQKLASLAIKDGLTGIYNQTYMKARIQEEISRSERYKVPLSLILIDLDDFKSINDKYGHVVGDRTLKAFADFLQDMVRSSDIAGRFGGEEFVIILPQTACLDAAAAAERLRQEVARYPFRMGAQRDKVCQFTISIGVYSSSQSGMTADDFLTQADEALYRAKQEGKNKVVVLVK